MTDHKTGTRQDWLAARLELLEAEKELTRRGDERPQPEVRQDSPWVSALAGRVGTDWPTYRRESAGMSAFALQDGAVYHTYSAYERGIDGLWGMYQWLDRAPLGRSETGPWWRRHDEYDGR